MKTRKPRRHNAKLAGRSPRQIRGKFLLPFDIVAYTFDLVVESCSNVILDLEYPCSCELTNYDFTHLKNFALVNRRLSDRSKQILSQIKVILDIRCFFCTFAGEMCSRRLKIIPFLSKWQNTGSRRGLQGASGTRGDTGMTVYHGVGTGGIVGIVGATGAVGCQGPVGSVGPQGNTGATGPTGRTPSNSYLSPKEFRMLQRTRTIQNKSKMRQSKTNTNLSRQFSPQTYQRQNYRW